MNLIFGLTIVLMFYGSNDSEFNKYAYKPSLKKVVSHVKTKINVRITKKTVDVYVRIRFGRSH